MQKHLRGLSFSFRIARRYLFSKKSHNAVNVISGISAGGVAVGAMALLCVLSVFNGFESLVGDMFSSFDPDLKVTVTQGKTFRIDGAAFQQVRKMDRIAFFTEVVEDNALLRFKNKQMPATIKGVSPAFRQMTQINKIICDGEFLLDDGAFQRSVPGVGVASSLGVGAHFIDPLYVYAPKRTSRVNILRPDQSFNRLPTFVSGVFAVRQAVYDEHYLLVSLAFARQLFEYDSNTVSSVEIKLKNPDDVESVKRDVQQILGDKYLVKNRYEQQENFFKIMKVEKWIAFLIVCFILLIASFNIIGSLSMLVIDKKDDIQTLRNLGADSKLIKQIFLLEGWSISAFGALTGIALGTILCLLQEYVGLVKLGSNFVVENYPVVTELSDVILVLLTVLAMGFLAAWYPVRYIRTHYNLNE